MATVAADLETQAVRPTSAKPAFLPLIALIGGQGGYGCVGSWPR